MSIIGLLFPGIVGLFLMEKFDKKWQLDIKDYIYFGAMFILFSNAITCVVVRIVWNFTGNVLLKLNLPIFFAKYVLISLIVNIFLAIFFVLVKRHIKVDIETKKKVNNLKGSKKDENR